MGEIYEFHECVVDCEMIELPIQLSRYTWKDKHGSSRIDSKIDWTFVNRNWLDNTPACIANYLPEGISDHIPVCIVIVNSGRGNPSAFKYCNTWSQHPQFLLCVAKGWRIKVKGYMMFQVITKLKELKHSLRKLIKQYLSNILKL